MPGPRARGLTVSPSRDRRQGVRHALLHTLPGRAIVIGLVARLIVYGFGLLIVPAPAFLRVIDTAAGVALAVGAAYFIVLFPALLIVAFFLLCGYLLFYNFSSYLVQSRLHALADEARFLAQSTAF